MLGPVKLTQVGLKATTYSVPGIKEKFCARYLEYVGMNTTDEISGEVQIAPNITLLCDFEVVAALKAIIKMGVTSNPELAKACREVFQSILKADPSYISKKRALAALSFGSYEKNELINGLKEVLS